MKSNFLILFCSLLSISLFAQNNFKTKTVSIFKNNNAFFEKNGKIQPDNNKHTIDFNEMPKASYGTFWMSGTQLKHISCYEKLIETPRTVNHRYSPQSNADFLKDNIGSLATLYLDNKETHTGKIVNVTNALVMLEQDGKWLTLSNEMIKSVALQSKPKLIDFVSKTDTLREKKKIAELEFSSNEPQDLDLVYFSSGIGWQPTYKIDLISEDKARITMQAGVTNDVEDLSNVDINFVVGYPNIKYGDKPSIFNLGLEPDNQKENKGTESNIIAFDDTRERAVRWDIKPTNVRVNHGQSVSIRKGQEEEDLYFYTLENISLPKGGRGFYTIFEKEIDYNHIYEVELKSNHSSYYRYIQADFNDPHRNKVWHTINLKNNTGYVWTHGAAMVVKNDGTRQRPISQDDLHYTSIGQEKSLKLTIGSDISVLDKEEEANRLVRHKKYNKEYFDLVTIKGKVRLYNYKSKDINLRVKKSMLGIPKSSNKDWQVSKQANVIHPYNHLNIVFWDITLKAGEEKIIEYEYDVYIIR